MMRREFLLIIFLFAGLCLIGAVDAFGAENLILNGDFEEGEGGWLLSARGAAAMEFVIDDEESISGKQSARFEVSNTGGGEMHDLTLDCGTPIKIKAGDTYTVDFWVKAEEDRTLSIDLLMNHDPWTNAFRIDNIPITAEWEVQHHTFKADFSDNNMVFLFSFSRGAIKNPTVTMWIDHVRFYEGEFEEEDLVGKPPEAVNPNGKFTGSWGAIKSSFF